MTRMIEECWKVRETEAGTGVIGGPTAGNDGEMVFGQWKEKGVRICDCDGTHLSNRRHLEIKWCGRGKWKEI
ncbi:hypothetical protein Trydic_g2075 [Trypoxylus dichotomus]